MQTKLTVHTTYFCLAENTNEVKKANVNFSLESDADTGADIMKAEHINKDQKSFSE